MKLPFYAYHYRSILIATIVSCFGVAVANAQDANEPDDQGEIDEIVVRATGSRLPASITSFPGSVTVIDQSVIESHADITSDIARILAFEVPGLATSSATASNFDQRLRGRKMAVYIDGIPISAPLRDSGRDVRALDPSAIGRIEVIRGSTALYGSSGAGGSINYLTKRPSGSDGWKGSSQVTLGSSLAHSSDSFNPLFRQNLEATNGDVDFIFSGSFEQYDSYFDADGDRIPANPNGNGGVAESDIFSAFAKIGFNWEDQRIEASYLKYDQDQDADYLLRIIGDQQAGIKTTGDFGQLDPRDQQEFNVNDVGQVSYIHSDIWGGDMQLQFYSQNLDQQFAWNASRGGGSNSRIQSDKSGFRLDLNTPLNSIGTDSTLLWGAEYASDKSQQTVNTIPVQVFVPEVEQIDLAFFAQFVIGMTDRLTLQGGIRYDDLELESEDFTVLTSGLEVMGGKTDYDSTAINLGMAFEISESVGIFGGFSQGYSLPDVGRVLRATTDTNPMVTIKPEPIEIDNYELGVRWNSGDITTSLAGWFNTSELGERFIPDPDSPPGVLEFIVTRQAQDFWGVEATIGGPLTNERGRWGGAITWVDGEIDTDDDGNPDSPVGNTSVGPIKITAFTDFSISETWSARVQLLYSGNRDEFDDAATSRSDHGDVDSFWTIDASTKFELGPGEMSIAISNLFNDQYFPTTSLRSGNRPDRYVAAPGAFVKVGYLFRF